MKNKTLLISFLFASFLYLDGLAQCNNLVGNGNAEAGITGWNFSSGYGITWQAQANTYGNAFVSSFDWCTMDQTIDLIGLGYSSQYLDQQPLISFSEMFKGRYTFTGDSADSFYFKIELLDNSLQLIDSYNFGSQTNPIITTLSWDTLFGQFFGYGPGLRYIRVENGGRDAENWAGNWGPIIDNCVVSFEEEIFEFICAGDTFMFDSIPTYSSGIYFENFKGVYGCDSNVVLHLTVDTVSLMSDFSQPECFGDSTGMIEVLATGGIGPYMYEWSNGVIDSMIVDLDSGSYTVTVSDVNGCSDSLTTILTYPDLLIADAFIDSIVSCAGLSDGGATVFAFGGTWPYFYDWSTSDIDSTVTDLPTGLFEVTVTDMNGCTDTSSVFIPEPNPVIAEALIDSNVSCNGTSDGAAFAQASGGINGYTFLWNNGTSGSTIDGLSAGTYTVTAIDLNGCEDSASIIVSEPNLLEAQMLTEAGVTCFNATNGEIDAFAYGGTSPFFFEWNNGSDEGEVSDLAAGTYSVTITDANGCTDSSSIILPNPPPILVTVRQEDLAKCDTCRDGLANAFAEGGVPIYSFLWSDSTGGSSNLGIAPGLYSVTVTDANGCTDSASVNIDFAPPVYTGEINTAFTPDGDDINDVWQIAGSINYPKMIVQVYNRWGTKVFQSDVGYKTKFDGTYNGNLLPASSYFFLIDFNDGMTKPRDGNLTIVY